MAELNLDGVAWKRAGDVTMTLDDWGSAVRPAFTYTTRTGVLKAIVILIDTEGRVNGHLA